MTVRVNTVFVHRKGWSLDTLLGILQQRGGQIEKDNDGQILIYTDLWEDGEGNLVKETESNQHSELIAVVREALCYILVTKQPSDADCAKYAAATDALAGLEEQLSAAQARIQELEEREHERRMDAMEASERE